jgi:tetratricopeptide (TPR) repeat protein
MTTTTNPLLANRTSTTGIAGEATPRALMRLARAAARKALALEGPGASTEIALKAGLQLSHAALWLGDPRAAANEARRVLRAIDASGGGGADPDGVMAGTARLYLAEALMATGHARLAIDTLEACVAGGGAHHRAAACANLAVACAREGRHAEAQRWAAEARADRDAGTDEAHAAAMAEALVLFQQGRTEDAVRVVRTRTRVEQRGV